MSKHAYLFLIDLVSYKNYGEYPLLLSFSLNTGDKLFWEPCPVFIDIEGFKKVKFEDYFE